MSKGIRDSEPISKRAVEKASPSVAELNKSNNRTHSINSLQKNSFIKVAQKGLDTRRHEIPRNEAYIEVRCNDEE
jgi:hypothetical protein